MNLFLTQFDREPAFKQSTLNAELLRERLSQGRLGAVAGRQFCADEFGVNCPSRIFSIQDKVTAQGDPELGNRKIDDIARNRRSLEIEQKSDAARIPG